MNVHTEVPYIVSSFYLDTNRFAEDAILTDRPSVGTSGFVLNKGSIQLESGAQKVLQVRTVAQ